MDRARAFLAFLALQSITTLISHRAAAGDLLSPLLQPLFNEVCNHSVGCGKGTCQASSDSMFGFICNCDPGWTQFHIGDHFRFLPCIVPNCSINNSCYNDTTALTPSPSARSTNFSLSDPCSFAYCGGGGTCDKTSNMEHRCECKEGFSNLLNQTSFPCYRDCALGADCAGLGISLPNSSPPSLSDNGSSSGGDKFEPSSLLWMVALVIPLTMALTR